MDKFDCILLYPLAYVAFYTLSHIVFYLRLLSPILGPFVSPIIYASIFSICLGALSSRYEALQNYELAQADPSTAKAGDATLSSSILPGPDAFVTALAKCLIGPFVAPLHPGRGFPPGTQYDDVVPTVGLAEDGRAPASCVEASTTETCCEDVLPSVEGPAPVLVRDDVQDSQAYVRSQSQKLEDIPPQPQEDVTPHIYQDLSPRPYEEPPWQIHENILPPARQVASEPYSLEESDDEPLSKTSGDSEVAELEYNAPVESDRDVLPQTLEDASLSVEQDVVGKDALETRSAPAFTRDEVSEDVEYEDTPPSPDLGQAPFEQDTEPARGEDLTPPQDDARSEHTPPPTWYVQAVRSLVLNEPASGRNQVDAVPEVMDSEDLPALDSGAESDEDGEDEVSDPSQVVGWESHRGGDGPYYIDDGPTEEEMYAAYNPPRSWWMPPLGYIARDPRLMDWEPVPREQCIPKPWGPPASPHVEVREVKMLDLTRRMDRLDMGPRINEVQMLDVSEMMDIVEADDMMEM